jgi:hypothetical protein
MIYTGAGTKVYGFDNRQINRIFAAGIAGIIKGKTKRQGLQVLIFAGSAGIKFSY